MDHFIVSFIFIFIVGRTRKRYMKLHIVVDQDVWVR